MVTIDEQQALAQVCDRLAERYPAVPPVDIRRAVDTAHRRLDGRPVRNYVPVLVERAARETLRAAEGPRAAVLTAH
ncbi:three-helix bundle dimerization domain-containing protein [Pengzhenrongella sicca]|uniref:Uncharacterized protein n=1 Tax=Pengzhenrongella sicca TaxID=2819238 RepID=A0A8A4Z8F4_9MICO|nr:hypothetical protein [Pengzhenrongella sicca]QTE28152.1 hypothetical protein J4E96_12210 [Pengzhenrongella sicca]